MAGLAGRALRLDAVREGLRAVIRRHVPHDMAIGIGTRYTVLLDVDLHITLVHGGRSVHRRLVLPEEIEDMISAVRDVLPGMVHELWAAGLSLAPDGDDVRQRSYAIANAVDMPAQVEHVSPGMWPVVHPGQCRPGQWHPTPPPTTVPAHGGCLMCGAQPGQPHRGCVLR